MSNLFSWVIFGLIVGVLAHQIDPVDHGSSLLGTLLLGMLGATVGGLLANLVFGLGVSGFNLISFMVAVVGALLLLWAQRAIRRV